MATHLGNLEYAPRPPMRRRVFKRAAGLVLALAVALSGWRWGRAMWGQCRYLYWQHEAMGYTASPGQVALEVDQKKAAQLLATNSDYRAVPHSWPRVGMAPRTYASLSPQCVRSLFPYASDGVAFLHERRSPDGQRRLVVATFNVECDPQSGPYLQFSAAYTWKPAGIWPGSRLTRLYATPNVQSHSVDLMLNPVEIYMGVPDPTDESHFTITLMVRAAKITDPPEPFVIDGWLRDGATLDVRPRHSATTARIAKEQVGRPDW